MKFIITRTSFYMYSNVERKPHEKAKEEKYLTTDQRLFQSFEEYDKKYLIPFTSVGTNHRINEKGIARDFEVKEWFIEINSLEDLLDFSKKEGPLIINTEENNLYPTIEIYDDYRE